MAFLYSTYIIIYAVANPLLGKYIDRVSASKNLDISSAIQNIAGVQFTIISACIIAATFIPRGAIAFNPAMINDEDLSHGEDEQRLDPVQDGFTEAGGDEKHAPVRI